MGRQSYAVLAIAVGFIGASPLRADDTPPADRIRAAIERSIPLLEKGAKGSADERQCFTCHSQAAPVLALAEVQRRGFSIDKENFERQLRHTAAHLKRGQENYRKGRGPGGKVITAGYALWTLEAGGRKADDSTAAVTSFLLEYQNKADRWRHPGRRPPSSGSEFMTTYVALRGLEEFGTDKQETKIEARRKQVGKWLLKAEPRDTEDRVFRLWALGYYENANDIQKAATAELLAAQRDDGGWAQTTKMQSDAYATGTVLVALIRAGGLSPKHAAVQRGIAYLLKTQRADGSWHVVTRAKPFQTYYESGFPHGKDQFISITASSWATFALALSAPERP